MKQYVLFSASSCEHHVGLGARDAKLGQGQPNDVGTWLDISVMQSAVALARALEPSTWPASVGTVPPPE